MTTIARTTIQTTHTRLFVSVGSSKRSSRVRGRETVALRNNDSNNLGNTVRGNAFSSSPSLFLYFKEEEEEEGRRRRRRMPRKPTAAFGKDGSAASSFACQSAQSFTAETLSIARARPAFVRELESTHFDLKSSARQPASCTRTRTRSAWRTTHHNLCAILRGVAFRATRARPLRTPLTLALCSPSHGPLMVR